MLHETDTNNVPWFLLLQIYPVVTYSQRISHSRNNVNVGWSERVHGRRHSSGSMKTKCDCVWHVKVEKFDRLRKVLLGKSWSSWGFWLLLWFIFVKMCSPFHQHRITRPSCLSEVAISECNNREDAEQDHWNQLKMEGIMRCYSIVSSRSNIIIIKVLQILTSPHYGVHKAQNYNVKVTTIPSHLLSRSPLLKMSATLD